MIIYSKVVDGSLTTPIIKDYEDIYISGYTLKNNTIEFCEMVVSITSDTPINYEDLPDGLKHFDVSYGIEGCFTELTLEFPSYKDLVGRLGYVKSGCKSKVVSSVDDL